MSTEQKPKAAPSKTLRVTILENEYEVKLPNSGEEIDIAWMLQTLSSDKYEQFKFSNLVLFRREALKIETIAFFNTLIPKLKENLNVKSFLLLDRPKMDVLIQVYEEQFLPWYEEWQTLFANPKPEEKPAE